MIVALLVASAVFVGVKELGDFWVWRYYLDENNQQERAEGYVKEFQQYVTDNKMSVKDDLRISAWSAGSYVDMIIYKDSTLFYAPDWFKDVNEDAENGGNGDIVDENGENGGENGEVGGENGENGANGDEGAIATDESVLESEEETATELVEESESDAEGEAVGGVAGEETTLESESSSSTETQKFVDKGWFSGDRGFVQYLTEEARETYLNRVDDILAGNVPLTPVYFVDGTLFVMVVDYTEEFMGNLVFAIAIVSALIVLVLIMFINFTNTTTRIKRLAHNVKLVESGELDRPIRAEGNDEISALASNVNSMRNSVVDNMTKERQAWEANTELITAMSHDIRTPLTVLLGYLDLIELQNSDPASEEYIAACKENAIRLKSLSDDMFSYFLVFGQRDLLPEALVAQSSEILESIMTEHQMLLSENGYTFETVGEMPDVSVLADITFLGRVIDNVFSNISKYADPETPVTINTRVDGEMLCVEFKNKIRHDDTHPESNRIGIKTCIRIMEKLGGSFDTESDDEFFTVTIKLLIQNE